MMEGRDKFREECGLMAIWGQAEASNLAYLGLYAQQHRGQEGVGIIAYDDTSDAFSTHKGLSLVQDVFRGFDFKKLPGRFAIGHVRYTTAGGNKIANVQPFFSEISRGRVGIAHNGNLINATELRKKLIRDGAIFATSSDTEVFLHLLARAKPNLSIAEAVISAISQTKGAFSLVLFVEGNLFLIRDPAGLRPLVLGRLGDSYIAASETCAFDLLGATYEREVEPGEVIMIDQNLQVSSFFPFGPTKPSPCIFEYVYFARPDSQIFSRNVYAVRKKMGEELERESHVDADIVVPVPDSGVSAAIGYSQASGIPLEMALIRNHYVGRTFIEPKQSIRDFGVKIKLNANSAVLQGKRVIVIDDSIVRGTTSKKLVKMLRQAGAAEIHLRISAPPTTDPCYYGIDTPQKEELIASSSSVEEIAKYIEVDSLAYLSLDGLYRATSVEQGKMCDACFTGRYPLGKPAEGEQQALFEE